MYDGVEDRFDVVVVVLTVEARFDVVVVLRLGLMWWWWC